MKKIDVSAPLSTSTSDLETIRVKLTGTGSDNNKFLKYVSLFKMKRKWKN